MKARGLTRTGSSGESAHDVSAYSDKTNDPPTSAVSGSLPVGDTGLAHSAFIGGKFAVTEGQGRAAVMLLSQPGAIVTGKDHERISIYIGLFKGLKDPAYR